jgi:hypothetical protein
MKINYIAIAEKAEELGACDVTNNLKLAARSGKIEEANDIILTHISWLSNRPKMECVMPKALWRIIADGGLDLYEKMARLMKALKIKRIVSMRESFNIINHIYLLRGGKLFFFDVFMENDDTCFVGIWERTSNKQYKILRNLPMKEMNNPDYVIKVCLKHIKENSNEN